MKTPVGSFELKIPRDRAGHFEPQVVKKHQTQLTDELERKVLALFPLGNSYQDIRTHIADLYGMSLSNVTECALDLPDAELEFKTLAIDDSFPRASG